MLWYLASSSTLLFVLGVIWNRNGWLNIFLKLVLLGMSFWGIFLTAFATGYIVKF